MSEKTAVAVLAVFVFVMEVAAVRDLAGAS
jgi:hypothetical protein